MSVMENRADRYAIGQITLIAVITCLLRKRSRAAGRAVRTKGNSMPSYPFKICDTVTFCWK